MKLCLVRFLSGNEERSTLVAAASLFAAYALVMATALEPTILEGRVL